MNDTPITDRARLASDRSMVFACDMGKLERVANQLAANLNELRALVKGESPQLLNEDSGGDARLDASIDKALAAFEAMKGTT